MPKLFVYGTLRRPVGGPAADTHFHERIAGEIRSATVARLANASLYDFGSYPGIGAGEAGVVGDLLDVTDAGLAEADLIEGHPDFYERRLETVDTDAGSVEAWVYWAPAAMLGGRPVVEGGDWFERDRLETATTMLEVADDETLNAAYQRLGDEPYSWFTSVRPDGRPHSVPMWHVVHGHRLYVVTPVESVKVANIAVNPAVVVALADPSDVVRIDGWAIVTTAAIPEVGPYFFTKYGWNPANEPEGSHVAVEVTPRVVSTWSDGESSRWIL